MRNPQQHSRRVESSMLWAAWADALGFISELTDAQGLRRRTKSRPLVEPYAWSRQIGGRFGVRANLPAGCYSDDTQLRLATSRAISDHGFDVEAFARVELSVWPSYALGGGRASKAAASGMSRVETTWSSNFYSGWTESGGNGVAMRIQPHVYAARDLDSMSYLDEVIMNGVVSHGHPRALVGAVLHAAGLGHALATGKVPAQRDWSRLFEISHLAIDAFWRRPELASYWRPRWESTTERDFERVWHETVDECEELVRRGFDAFVALERAGGDREAATEAYTQLVHSLDLADEASRGSATKTVVAAMLLSSAVPEHPARAAQLASASLGTDTDTIATMAAAIVGAATPRPLTSPVLDEEYLAFEAHRLSRIAAGDSTEQFPYPDLLRFRPPKSGLDSVGMTDSGTALAGVALLEPSGETYDSRDALWTWMKTNFGQTILIKHRRNLPYLPPASWPAELHRATNSDVRELRRVDESLPLFEVEVASDTTHDVVEKPLPGTPIDLPRIFEWLERERYRDSSVGYALRRVAESGNDAQVDEFSTQLRIVLRGRESKS